MRPCDSDGGPPEVQHPRPAQRPQQGHHQEGRQGDFSHSRTVSVKVKLYIFGYLVLLDAGMGAISRDPVRECC